MSIKKFLFDLAKAKPSLIIISLFITSIRAIFYGIEAIVLVNVFLILFGYNNPPFLSSASTLLSLAFTFLFSFQTSQKLIGLIGLLILVVFLKNTANYCGQLINNYYSNVLVNSMRLQGINILCEVELDFFIKNKVGDIIVRINRELDRTNISIISIQKILVNSILIIIFIGFLILISWQLTLVSTFLIIILNLGKHLFLIEAEKSAKSLAQQSRTYSRKILEFLTKIRLIKTLATEEKEHKILVDLVKAREKAQFKTQAIAAIGIQINEIYTLLIILILIVVSRYLFESSIEDFIPIILTYLILLFRLLPFVEQLNNARIKFANNFSSTTIVADFLRRNNKPFLLSGQINFNKLKSGINFQGVSFAYPGYKQLILNHINLWIPQGKTIALIDTSGKIKSTIGELLARFYDPSEGQILVDGKDLKEYNIKSFRQKIGLISHDAFLFNNSITYNISYGLQNATDQDIIAAAKKAQAYDFINQLPAGFDTEIGARGVKLSGIQKQKIAIARTILHDPDILIWEQANSILNNVSEKSLQKIITELCRDRTTLIITNCLSNIQTSHQIVVLDQGRIAEQGTHQELLKKQGLYARLYMMQFKNTHQSHQKQLAQKIYRKLMSQNKFNLSWEISNNLNSLLGSLQLINNGSIEDSQEQEKLLDESYEAAQKLLDSIKEYEQNLHEKFEQE